MREAAERGTDMYVSELPRLTMATRKQLADAKASRLRVRMMLPSLVGDPLPKQSV